MRVLTEKVGANGSLLTCYALDSSPEMTTADRRPVVLVLPGGGYSFTSDREAEPVAAAYLAEGFHACVLRYAAGPDAPWSASYADGLAGLAWIREHADEWGFEPAKIAVVGFSAGGHLAASLGVAAERPDALVLGYPVTLGEMGPPVGKEILDVPSAVTADYPPTFLFSTSGDSLVPIGNSLALLSKLAEHEVPFESHIYLLGPHGLSLAKSHTANGRAAMIEPAVAGWLPDSVRFLNSVFGDFALHGEPSTYAALLRRRRLGLDAPLKRILADERAVAAMEQAFPGFASMASNPMAGGLSLRELAQFQPDLLTADALDALGRDLEALND